MRQYRVITQDFGNKVAILTDWTTRAACRRFILSRWGHWPPFAHISSGQINYLLRTYTN